MKKTALFISLLCFQQAIVLPLNVSRTESSKTIPVAISISEVTSAYKEVDPSLYYYRIDVTNSSLDFQVKVLNESIAKLGYKHADSTAWSNTFWRPFVWYEGTMVSITALAAAALLISQKSPRDNVGAFITGVGATGATLAIAGLIAQACRQNKAAHLSNCMTVSKAEYVKISGDSITIPTGNNNHHVTIKLPSKTRKEDSSKFMVFSTTQPLSNLEIDVVQNGIVYEITLVAK